MIAQNITSYNGDYVNKYGGKYYRQYFERLRRRIGSQHENSQRCSFDELSDDEE
jgi:hypothetical protein